MNISEERDQLLKSMNASLKSKKLYPAGHPAIVAPVGRTFQLLSETLKGRNNIAVSMSSEALLFDGTLLSEAERLYPDIMIHMTEKNIDAIIFERGATEKELSNLFDVLSGPKELKGKQLQNELHARGIVHITLKSIPLGKRNSLEVYNGALDVVKNVMNEVRMGKLPKSEAVNTVIDEVTETVLSDRNAMIGLTMIKNYDNYLYNHSVNVSILSLALGCALNLDKTALHALGVASMLHDIGKTGVSEKIIRKPGGLSSDEWDKIKEHPQLGANITKRMDGLDERVSTLIYEHHIRFDHSGYPQMATAVHPLSQIITIADAYDALTTLRVYQKPYSPVEAIKIMSNLSGRHFSPETLKTFVDMMGLYPVGTMVRLNSYEIAIIVRVGDSPDRPCVKVIYDPEGKAYQEPIDLDLSSDMDKTILSNVNPAVTGTALDAFFEKEAARAAAV
ncbi:MAG: HD-GYP domain-containing protein [Deltaproteobacteria bacterium]